MAWKSFSSSAFGDRASLTVTRANRSAWRASGNSAATSGWPKWRIARPELAEGGPATHRELWVVGIDDRQRPRAIREAFDPVAGHSKPPRLRVMARRGDDRIVSEMAELCGRRPLTGKGRLGDMPGIRPRTYPD